MVNIDMEHIQQYRTEKDSLGEVKVPSNKLWGAQTQRSLDHFKICDHKMPKEIIEALLIIKGVAAKVNLELGILSQEKSELIQKSIQSLSKKNIHEEFPLSVWQTGSGTQSNMNVNEVIANQAAFLMKMPLGKKEPIHPNDDVNLSQSSNDVFPTAMHIAFCSLLHHRLYPSVQRLIETLQKKEQEFSGIIKVGRTHLMDAVPMLLSDEFSAFRAQITSSLEAIRQAEKHLHELALGGTAIGTGLNCPEGFQEKAISYIAEQTAIPFIKPRNNFEALSCHDSTVEFSGALRRLAISFIKLANDIRLLASGPRCGFGELIVPENEPGSSIMPGKVNPTQCESMAQVACQVIGNDAAIATAATHGHLQLHVFKPVLAKNCIESIHLLSDSCSSFIDFCLKGIQPNKKKIEEHLNNSLMLITALSPVIGYDKTAEIALYAHHHNTTLKEAALHCSNLSSEQFDTLCDPQKMIGKKRIQNDKSHVANENGNAVV